MPPLPELPHVVIEPSALRAAKAFTAVKPDGSIRTWGDSGHGGAYASDYNLALGKGSTL
jgi:hypothetical protein